MLAPADFFDLSTALHAAAFTGATYTWEALATLPAYIQQQLATDFPPGIDPAATVHPTAVINTAQVHIGAGVVIMPQVYIEGPAIINAGATVVQGAYVRANVVISPGAIVGHADEIKHALLLEKASAPHFAYIGDSILGARVNLGAGTKLSNVPLNSQPDPATGQRHTLKINIQGTVYDTGLAKFGAIIGDDVMLGCNSVTNPGTLIGRRTLIYALASLEKGYYPPDSIVKMRQSKEIVQRK